MSEDPAGNGKNWFAYCGGDPVNYSDRTGKARGEEGIRQFLAMLSSGLGMITFGSIGIMLASGAASAAQCRVPARLAILAYGIGAACANPDWKLDVALIALDAAMGYLIDVVLLAAEAGKNCRGLGAAAVSAVTAYSLVFIAELAADMMANGVPFSD